MMHPTGAGYCHRTGLGEFTPPIHEDSHESAAEVQ
jgi:hypothetical protein